MTLSGLGVARPILLDEFVTFLRRCRPPTGWPTSIAVANSGGPDSTCLLHLFKVLSESEGLVKGDDYKPGRVISLSVDHGLQSASNTMAEVAAATASRLGIEHTGTRIPWSKHPFPDVPKSGIESIARLARYHVLLDNLRTQDTHVLALGHHADDQQETALMRFDRNGKTSMADIAAMRPIRRWGMGVGVEGELGFSGVYGINRWLIRPLLGVRKDRILATCEAHGLDYITDKTNFQPDLTPRNAIRKQLTEADGKPIVLERAIRSGKGEAAVIRKILQSGYTDTALSLLNRSSTISVDRDRAVTRKLRNLRNTIKPPPSTFVLPTRDLRGLPLRSHSRLITRILRYVSPCPWGSPDAEAGRRSDSIRLILRTLLQLGQVSRRKFVAGGWVQWTPVVIRADGKIARRDLPRKPQNGSSERKAWLAERQPPFVHKGAYRTENLVVDLTDWINKKDHQTDVEHPPPSLIWKSFKFRPEKDAMSKLAELDLASKCEDSTPDSLRAFFLWDNRFLLDFDIPATRTYLEQAGGAGLRVRFDPFNYCLPTLHFTDSNGKTRVVPSVPGDDRLPFVRAAFLRPLGEP